MSSQNARLIGLLSRSQLKSNWKIVLCTLVRWIQMQELCGCCSSSSSSKSEHRRLRQWHGNRAVHKCERTTEWHIEMNEWTVAPKEWAYVKANDRANERARTSANEWDRDGDGGRKRQIERSVNEMNGTVIVDVWVRVYFLHVCLLAYRIKWILATEKKKRNNNNNKKKRYQNVRTFIYSTIYIPKSDDRLTNSETDFDSNSRERNAYMYYTCTYYRIWWTGLYEWWWW